VAGLLGAYLFLNPYAPLALLAPRALRSPEDVVAPALLWFWLLAQLFSGLAAFGYGTMFPSDGSWWAHVGGFLAGLLGEVRDVLWDYEPLRATRAPLTLDADAGRVRLGGRTRTEALRLLAGYLVSYVEGVVAVENAIVSDDMVQRAVADALAADPVTAPHCLQVAVRYGEVRLIGAVTDPSAAPRAVEIARTVPTVVAAASEIATIRPAQPGQSSNRFVPAS
jgi:hypothetical protein